MRNREEAQIRELLQHVEVLASQSNNPTAIRATIRALTAITNGSRDPALADDPELHYQDAVEIQLLLEALAETNYEK